MTNYLHWLLSETNSKFALTTIRSLEFLAAWNMRFVGSYVNTFNTEFNVEEKCHLLLY
jgi:hypothetical protein